MKTKPNPDYFVYTKDDEAEFIKNWKPYYERKRFSHLAEPAYRVVGDGPGEQGYFPPYRRREIKDHYTISRIYWLGRAYGIVQMDYKQFAEAIHPSDEYGPRYYGGSRWRWYRRGWSTWYDYHGVWFREKMPLHITEKKELPERERQRREWRKTKGIDRDKAKNGWGHSWRKPQRAGKQTCNREYRRHERMMIQKEKFERLTKVKPKNYFDPWRFD